MTIEEAIINLEDGIYWLKNNEEPELLKRIRFSEALEIAISALRAQQAAEKNESLTLKELDEHRTKELPVWCEMPVLPGITAKGWGIAGSGNAVLQNFSSRQLWYQHYGRDWVAYSRRPVKEAQDED